MKADQLLVEKVLNIYNPSWRYLKEVDVNYPDGTGFFRLDSTEYAETLQHLTDAEAQICLNQLCYVFFGHGIVEGWLKGMEDLSIDEYLDMRKNHMFVAESRKRFRRETNSREPFYGNVHVTHLRKHGNMQICAT